MEERIMKKYFSNIFALAALLMTGAAFAACSSDDNISEQPANPSGEKTYTLTVNASKGANASTRALELSGTKLLAKWAESDELSVFKAENRTGCIPANSLGTISPVAGSISADGKSATFTGNLTGSVVDGDKLMLVYHYNAFSVDAFASQTGTLESASALDCATAQVTASVSGSDITIKETSATFTTHTAMLKLTLTTDGTTTINPTALKMSMSAGSLTLKEFSFAPTADTYSANGNGVLYFALPSAADVAAGLSTPSNPITTTQLAAATITYTATVGSDTYVITKKGYAFAAGKYYAGTLKMTSPWDGNLTTITKNVTAIDGMTITGTLDDRNLMISIADGATVKLSGITIDVVSFAGITCEGDATIILEGTNNITGNFAISAPERSSLVIKGNGSLTANKGIITGGDIQIEGGTITATAMGTSAAIGAATNGTCGNISISGGTVTATSANSSAGIRSVGIGAGDGGTCGNISISGGTVTATGAISSAGIGTGQSGTCGDISITGGTITATGGELAAGIGGGAYGKCGNITIAKTITRVEATHGGLGTHNGFTTPYSIGVGSDYGDFLDTKEELIKDKYGTITFDNVTFTPTWQQGTDSDHPNSWIYSPEEPANGTYGGLTLTISGNTWTLVPKP